ncbi:hypothetical protein LTR64_001768 [Lithohypha guttulata]|uniref:uncharacterized protein n=1 Tax=Lithohypha guttulata TaxID=1690604 RepID=UPI002DDEF7A4|nr:hypothetical protein LTR51_003962 [Lithohypha guttulata]
MDGTEDRGRSPNLNINRWSHSTSSSVGMIDSEVLRQVAGNAAPARSLQPALPTKAPLVSKYQSSRQPSESSMIVPSPTRSPGRYLKSSSRQASSDQISNLASTPEAEVLPHGPTASGYFGTTMVDHSRGANKYGQPVEGIALQLTSGPSRQRRLDHNKFGNGLYQTTNSSHISLQKKPSQGRRRDRSQNNTTDIVAGKSRRSSTGKRGDHRSPTQKNMLSQALAKANQAVLLDNAQNIHGAIQAYNEACDVLERVMMRSNDPDDCKKLSAIRTTYSTRIAELYDLDDSFDYLNTDKELPEAPVTTRYLEGQDRVSFEDPEDDEPQSELTNHDPRTVVQLPPRQESLLPSIYGGEEFIERQPLPFERRPSPSNNLAVPMDAQYMPPPLSPRRPLSPVTTDDQSTPIAPVQPNSMLELPGQRLSSGSISWLDTAGDENNSSVASSPRSSMDVAGRDNELMSAIEADLDAAVEAAYGDDYTTEATPRPPEAAEMPPLGNQPSPEVEPLNPEYEYLTRDYLDAEAQEEEELLEMMMADGYTMEDQYHHPGAMSSLPRQSDSSGFSARSSGRTWESSATAATQGTALSTLAESPEIPQQESFDFSKEDETTLPAQDVSVLAQKQASPLPPLPVTDKPATLPLRDRRLSGQSAKQLKIETFARRLSISQQEQPAQALLLEVPSESIQYPALIRSASNTNMSVSTMPITPLASVHSSDSTTDSIGTPGLTQLLSSSTNADDVAESQLMDTHPDLNDRPSTPASALFTAHSRSATSITTPVVPTVSPNALASTSVGGSYIFDHIAEPRSPQSPQSTTSDRNEPLPLEPCPESFLLRPFWLMRCLYQTLAHPKGGFLTTKLFVPRDIWRVRNVKIKAIDEKIGHCDLLTAALLKLAKVDTLDADAVLEELQSFDAIIDNVRQALGKKLGNDVGLSGSMMAMNKSPLGEEHETTGLKTAASVKSIASGWRKLRSKSSAPALTPQNLARRDTANDTTLASLPMTGRANVATSRSYKAQKLPPPTPVGMPHILPQHASYMSSLARLFDAVQVLDSIARQVEDPGLKATNKTQVGLELSIRGAAEFFSFYVIRFAMADIGLLVDKYLKRNGEWIML